jgi:ribosomal protein L40E
MEKKVWLSAEVLAAGVTKNPVCPTCGGVKSIEAYTCKKCRINDVTVTKAVKTFDEAVAKAVEGHNAAVESGKGSDEIGLLNTTMKLDISREILIPHVLANVYVQKNAQMRYPKSTAIAPYLEMMLSIDGGHIKMFIFGATKGDIGKMVTGIVEMKLKKEKFGNEVPYLRMQTISGVMSTVDISFDNKKVLPGLPSKFWISTLTRENGEKRNLLFTFGYKPVEVVVERKLAEA